MPSLVQTLVVGPDHQVGGARRDLLGTTGASVRLAGAGRGDGTDAPLAIRTGFGTTVTQATGQRPGTRSLLTVSAGHVPDFTPPRNQANRMSPVSA